MKIKEYIETKRQYTPPRIHVKVLLMEGLLAGVTAESTVGNGGSGDGNGGNPPIPPFGGGGAKANTRLFFDDVTEEIEYEIE